MYYELSPLELQQSTASLLSQPRDCPMAISSVVLRQPSLSRMSSNSALPQIASPTDPVSGGTLTGDMSRSRGAFASNYVVNHLKGKSEYHNQEDLGSIVSALF